MSEKLTRAEELVQKVQSDPELIKKLSGMTKEEAMDLAKELGYGDVGEEELIEVLKGDKELKDGDLGEVAGGDYVAGAEYGAVALRSLCG